MPPRKPVEALPSFWMGLPARFLSTGSLLFDPVRLEAAPGREVGTPSVPTSSERHGAQGRSRAAPLGAGTAAARSHAQPPFGGEHGEHGEDPPLDRPEHRGTCPQARQVIHIRPQRKVQLR